MSRRTGQRGSVEVRNGMYRGRYLVDVPGQEGRVNRAVILGPVSEMTKSEARRKLLGVIEQDGVNKPDYAIPSSELFEKHVQRWRLNYLVRQKPSSQRVWDCIVNKHLLRKWGRYPVDSIKADMVNEWLGELEHLAPATQRDIVKTLQVVLGRKFGRGIHYPANLEARRAHPCHTPEQMQAITNAAKEPYRTLFAVATETGMRSGELYGLRVEDIDYERLLIHVRRSVWEGKAQAPKTKQAYRAIDIQPELAGMLRLHLNGRKDGWVFQSRKGTPLQHPHVLIRGLYPVLKKLGIPQSGMHAFRHGRVSYLVECDTPVETIRAWIGHGSDEMVRHYTHSGPSTGSGFSVTFLPSFTLFTLK